MVENVSVNYELGVDFNSNFCFEDGDLVLIKYDDNLVQSICNRLNTDLNELSLFYRNYGSIILSFLGWKANNETLSFIKSELETVLQSETRLTAWNYDVEYTGNGTIKIDLTVYVNSEESINAILSIGNNGVEVIS